MSYLSQLKLQHFRCYEKAAFDGLSSGLIVLHGENGAGKTNILEAVSMLSPGRGLRSAKTVELQRSDSSTAWGIAGVCETKVGPVKLGTGLDPLTDKRVVRINGVNAKSQNALFDFISCIWLTPQMDRLFIEGAGTRRRFFDRLVFAFDPGHSGRVARYENVMRQRSRLLQEGGADPAWLKSLELQMAETGISIAAARLDFIQKLQKSCDLVDEAEEAFFPRALIKMQGTVEELLQNSPAVEVEEMFAYQLEQSRDQDARTGGAATGPHKSDMVVTYAVKNMPAAHCSTGEQKALLITMIIAHGRLLAAEKGAPPILLLDEVAAHLDEGRRAALYGILRALGGQVWMTGTDLSLFDSIAKKAQFFNVKSSVITRG
ncbi:MAG: DNA replication/repair protein RecF [Micavibrio sp.]|nr:DNA replication/repair protein RecF [Micavibrio sp.]